MKNTMTKASIILSAIIGLGFASTAEAISVDGNINTTEWAGHYAAEDDVGSSGYVGPGYGGQSFDVEYIGLKFTPGGQLYFGLQTGFDVINNVKYGGTWYYAGDFGLNVDADPFYEYAIDFTFTGTTPTYTLWQVSTWQDVKYTQHMAGTPYQKKIAAQVPGTFTGAYGTTTTNVDGGVSHILEGSLNMADLTLYSGGPVTLHWTMNCGNDYLNHTATPEPVPEPSTLVLLGAGILGLSAWRLRKKKC